MLVAFALIVLALAIYITVRLWSIRAMNEDRTEMDADYDALRRE
mgnify:CR=1 FL=1